ncbi:OmcA/MtrC family decaheme c-type cytochrome [Shewanella carassii]|nr:OmcA/MtrC family decaheme c-type cytochrome [Shewanella carassii]
MMKNHNKSLLALALTSLLCLTACGDGEDGKDGAPGEPGIPGEPGQPGAPAGSGTSTIISAGDVSFEIVPADNTLAGGEAFALKFKASATNGSGERVPLTGLDQVALYSITAMSNSSGSGAPLQWVNNATAQELGSSMYCTLDGTYSSRGQTGNACLLVEDPAEPGTYTGTWEHDGVAPIMNANDDLNAPHRLFLRAYNLKDASGAAIADKVLSTPLDYIPASGELVEATGKDTVTDAACIACHGEVEGRIAKINAHHNYQSTEKCVACHNPALVPDEAQKAEGWVFDFGPMVHRLHAGHHIAGFLSGEAKEYFGEIGFPAELNNCASCHNNGDSWNANIYREACVGCHINVNFETGVGHSDFNLAQADDSQCQSCHGSGALSPMQAHKVGKRAEYAELLTVEFTSATAAASTTAGNKLVTITANVSFNGQPLTDAAQLAVLNKDATLIGNVDTRGEVTRWGSRPGLASGSAVNGVLTLTADVPEAQAMGTIYVGTEANFCVDNSGKIAACAEGMPFDAVNPIGATSSVKFYNLDGGDAVTARFAIAERMSASEAKCNACHGTLDYIKGTRHGTYTFDQCMDCHNNSYYGSYHGTSEYNTGNLDADGKPIFAEVPGLLYANRDLMTVAHRFHSGNWGEAAIFRDASGELHGYPGVETECAACHKDETPLFAADGGLTSAKRAIKISASEYISPVAESCRTCHAHSDAAALAHFKSNGALVAGDAATDANLPVESCATCHAEGKTYGVDKVHAGGAH